MSTANLPSIKKRGKFVNPVLREYLDYLCRRANVDLSNVKGMSRQEENELNLWQKEKGIYLPSIYIEYITCLGPSYEFLTRDGNMEGNVSSAKDFDKWRSIANSTLSDNDAKFRLNENAFVICTYLEEVFFFFTLDGSDDPPVMKYGWDNLSYYEEFAPSFTKYLQKITIN